MVSLLGGFSPLTKGPHWPEGTTAVHRCIGTCDVAEELETSGTEVRMNDACGWSVDHFIRDTGPSHGTAKCLFWLLKRRWYRMLVEWQHLNDAMFYFLAASLSDSGHGSTL